MARLGIPELPIRDSFRFVKEQGIAAFMAMCLLAFLGWAFYVWSNVLSSQVVVLQKQTDILVIMHEDHLHLAISNQQIVTNQAQIIELLQQAALTEKADNDLRDRQNEILRRLEERTR